MRVSVNKSRIMLFASQNYNKGLLCYPLLLDSEV
jgi:hypothetical protein